MAPGVAYGVLNRALYYKWKCFWKRYNIVPSIILCLTKQNRRGCRANIQVRNLDNIGRTSMVATSGHGVLLLLWGLHCCWRRAGHMDGRMGLDNSMMANTTHLFYRLSIWLTFSKVKKNDSHRKDQKRFGRNVSDDWRGASTIAAEELKQPLYSEWWSRYKATYDGDKRLGVAL